MSMIQQPLCQAVVVHKLRLRVHPQERDMVGAGVC